MVSILLFGLLAIIYSFVTMTTIYMLEPTGEPTMKEVLLALAWPIIPILIVVRDLTRALKHAWRH